MKKFWKVVKGKRKMDFAEYVKCLKKYVVNQDISDEEFVNAVLEPYVMAGKIKNKQKEDYWLNKSRVSRLLSGQDDIPKALRNSLGKVGIYEETRDNFDNFIQDYLIEGGTENLKVELKKIMINDDDKASDFNDKNNMVDLKELLATILIETIRLPNGEIVGDTELARNGAYSVKVIYGDIFNRAFGKKCKNKRIIVVPVDTMFRTYVTRSYENQPYPEVSPKTIHGQWIIRMEQSGEDITSLGDRIFENLKNTYGCDVGKDIYPKGTIAVIENNCSIFYLVALSEFDKHNNAYATKEEVLNVIDSLMDFYDKHGDGNDIYIPLLGTGKSRAGMSLQESYDSLQQYFKSNVSRVQGNVFIVVHKQFKNQMKKGGQ